MQVRRVLTRVLKKKRSECKGYHIRNLSITRCALWAYSSLFWGFLMIPSSLTWNSDSKTATNIELATLVNSPIDVTFLVDIPTTDKRLFVFERTVDGSLSTGPWNRWIIAFNGRLLQMILLVSLFLPISLKVTDNVTSVYASVTTVQPRAITTDTAATYVTNEFDCKQFE